MDRWSVVVAALLVGPWLAGCHRHPKEPAEFAHAFIDAGRTGRLTADWVDDTLIERVRRAERLNMAARAGAPAEQLTAAWRLPLEPGGAKSAERAAKQRERAQSALQRNLTGTCDVRLDDEGLKKRVAAITQVPANALPEAKTELASLTLALAGAQLARVSCTQGAVGLLLVPHAPDWRVVDIFALGPIQGPAQ